MGVHEYLTRYRTVQASYLLKQHSVTEVSYLCGFCDSSHFIAVFKGYYGITPAEYQKTLFDK
ncbi:MAG: helix-turn-helix transcriptional regulator [Clostridia bacterium]|nr:helix-turn-helix transcriptional regulator [Clostridia bacterium]